MAFAAPLRLRSAQRFFIASESFFLPAALMPAVFLGLADALASFALETAGAPFLFAQRCFIASDSLRRPAGVRPRPRRSVGAFAAADPGGRPTRFLAGALVSSKPMTSPIRTNSPFSSATILCMSKHFLLSHQLESYIVSVISWICNKDDLGSYRYKGKCELVSDNLRFPVFAS